MTTESQQSNERRSFFVEATSDVPNESPTVLFNISGGPINYIEVHSQASGRERARVVFANGNDYDLRGERASNLLRSLRDSRSWHQTQTTERTRTASGQ